MVWSQIEPTPPHLTYLLLSSFLISYVLFTNFFRNRLHLSEPPIALITGIIIGPRGLGWFTPNKCGSDGCGNDLNVPDSVGVGGYGLGDDIVQEMTRIILGIQVFAIGVELPKYYASRHWKSVAMLLGPVMIVSWITCAVFVYLIFGTNVATALTVSACLTPTDPVLAASILSNSQFSTRVPKRIKDMLSAESGCNDGISFPFLYIGIFLLTENTIGQSIKDWFLITVLWQCCFGIFIGLVMGTAFNKVLRFSQGKGYIDHTGFVVFYLLLALLCVGVGSTLGSDDFLVAFGCGYGFARDGWFRKHTKSTHLPNVIDLLLNSAMFVYFGSIIPWFSMEPGPLTPSITPGRLLGFLALVLFFRRIPVVLATYRWIPDIKTIQEALFCGHFGPMGLGALFLAIEARGLLENGKATPDPMPPRYKAPGTPREQAVAIIWPLVAFVVFGSTIVHGFSVLALSVYTSLNRPKHARSNIIAGETDPLEGMEHQGGAGDSEPSDDSELEEDHDQSRVHL